MQGLIPTKDAEVAASRLLYWKRDSYVDVPDLTGWITTRVYRQTMTGKNSHAKFSPMPPLALTTDKSGNRGKYASTFGNHQFKARKRAS